jgi:DNA-binding transcriptional regulator YdaS (Cro superfamily)
MSARFALKKALEAVGGPVALAKKLRITSQAISQWDKVPPFQVLKVARITGIAPHELRPDLYPMNWEAAE